MGVVSARLIKDWNGIKAGQTVQVLEPLYKSLQENGFFANPDLELAALKKKSKSSLVVPDANKEE